VILTDRLELIPGSAPQIQAALVSDLPELGKLLNAAIPPTWPPQFLDADALRFTLERVTASPADACWWLHFVVLRDPRILIGSAGYKGPPSLDGTVEVGYGIVSDQHRRGYASEAVRGMVRHAFSLPSVTRVVAETLPELIGSIGVLQRCGFRFIGDGSEAGVIRFELRREG
jgi:RimJ/RimL family protein N-acetyltransferase